MADVPIGDYEAHVRLWTHMLRTFIGWSDDQVARWALWCKEASQDENDWFYNEPPEFYVACLLTPKNLAKKLGAMKYSLLEAQVQAVLYDVLVSAKTIEEIDWQPAKEKIDAILSEYGESLAGVTEENADRYRD